MTDTDHQPLISYNRNRWIAYALTGGAIAMLGVAFAAVPLYNMFCQVTGFGGTTMRADANPKGTIDREMTVRFDVSVNRALPWSVHAAAPVKSAIGTTETVVYTATNLSSKTVTGTAGFNVTPDLAGGYFNKMECFCFTEQTLQPGETVEMPIVFFVDPDIADSKDLRTVNEITLSYTFYASENEGS